MTYKIRLTAMAIAATLLFATGAHVASSQTASPTPKPSYALPTKRGVSDVGRLIVLVRAAAQTQAAPAPGLVPSRFGSPDPREHTVTSDYFAGLVPSQLGSQDPRDTARAAPGVAKAGKR